MSPHYFSKKVVIKIKKTILRVGLDLYPVIRYIYTGFSYIFMSVDLFVSAALSSFKIIFQSSEIQLPKVAYQQIQDCLYL